MSHRSYPQLVVCKNIRAPQPNPDAFSAFFQNLERPYSAERQIHRPWIERIRRDMEAANTWPIGPRRESAIVTAELVSRLQRCFWDYAQIELAEGKRLSHAEIHRLRPALSVLYKVHCRIQRLSYVFPDALYVWPWFIDRTPYIDVVDIPLQLRLINVRPFTDGMTFESQPFNRL